MAFLVLAVAGVASSDHAEAQLALTVAALAVAAALLAFGSRVSEIDSALTTRRAGIMMIGAGIATIALRTLIVAMPDAGRLAAMLLVPTFLALALGWHRHRMLNALSVMPLIGLAGVAALYASLPVGATLNAAASSMALVAYSLGAAGAAGALQLTASRQRSAAFDAERRRELADSMRVDVESRYAATLHEVRSTVLALAGGMRTLETSANRTPSLTGALVSELERLRSLVTPEPQRNRDEFSVRDAIAPVLLVAEANGSSVRCSMKDDAFGPRMRERLRADPARARDERTTVCAQLHDPRQRAGGRSVRRGQRRRRRAGYPRDDCDRIFEPGERSTQQSLVDGQGLGLHIGRRLARDSGGDLWAEHRPGHGARFVLALPNASYGDAPLMGERRAS